MTEKYPQAIFKRAQGVHINLEADLLSIARTDQEKRLLRVGSRLFERSTIQNNFLLQKYATPGEEVEWLLTLSLLSSGKTKEEVRQLFSQPYQAHLNGPVRTVREAVLENVRFENVRLADTNTLSGILVLHATDEGNALIERKLRLIKRPFGGYQDTIDFKEGKLRYIVVPEDDSDGFKEEVLRHELQHHIWSSARLIRLMHYRKIHPKSKKTGKPKSITPTERKMKWFHLFQNELLAYATDGRRSRQVEAYVYDSDYSLNRVPLQQQEKADMTLQYLSLWEVYFNAEIDDANMMEMFIAEDYSDIRNALPRPFVDNKKQAQKDSTFNNQVYSLFDSFAMNFITSNVVRDRIHFQAGIKALSSFIKDFQVASEVISILSGDRYFEAFSSHPEDYPIVLTEFCNAIGIDAPDLSSYYEFLRLKEQRRRITEDSLQTLRRQARERQAELERQFGEEGAAEKERLRLSEPPKDIHDLRERHSNAQLGARFNELPFGDVKYVFLLQAIAVSHEVANGREKGYLIPFSIRGALTSIPEPYDNLLPISTASFSHMLTNIMIPFFEPEFLETFYSVSYTPDFDTFVTSFFTSLLTHKGVSSEDSTYIKAQVKQAITIVSRDFERNLQYRAKHEIRREKYGENVANWPKLTDMTLSHSQLAQIKKQARSRADEFKELIGLLPAS